MTSHINMQEFNNFISDTVGWYERSNGLNHERISSYLGVSESFIKQIHSYQSKAHYNAYHLWKLSQLFDVTIDDLLLPVNDFGKFIKIRPNATKEDYMSLLNKYKSMEEQ